VALLPTAAGAQGTTHQSCEADEGHPCCVVRIPISLPGGEIVSFAEVGRIFPEWEGVERGDADYMAGLNSNVVLEGTVATAVDNNAVETGPHVSFEDTPFGHDTHDFAFKVIPDAPYQYLLGIKVVANTPDGGVCSTQTEETCVPNCQLEPPPEGSCPPPCSFDLNGNCLEFPGGPACLVCPSGCEQLPDGTCRKQPGTDTCDSFTCGQIQGLPGCTTTAAAQDLIEVEW